MTGTFNAALRLGLLALPVWLAATPAAGGQTTAAPKFAKLKPGDRPLSAEPVFPERPARPKYAARLRRLPNGGYTTDLPELPLKDAEGPAGPADAAAARRLLRRTARFFAAQDSVSFEVDFYTDEQGTMGFVGGNSAVYRVALAKPNRLAVIDKSYRTFRLRSNGEHFMRRASGRVYVEGAAASLAGALKRPSARPPSIWRLDAPNLLALFDPAALEDLLKRCRVDYRGTRDYGGVKTDHVVIDTRGKKGSTLWPWSVYLARGRCPVPVRIVPNYDRAFGPDLAKRQRFSGTDWRFGAWAFNDPATEEAFALKLPDAELVDSLAAMNLGEPTAVNPMVGRRLPEFTAVGADGGAVKSRDLLGKKPFIVYFWSNSNRMASWWPSVSKMAQKYAEAGVKVYTIYTGDETPDEISKQFAFFQKSAPWPTDPVILKRCDNLKGFAAGGLPYNFPGRGRKREPGKFLQPYLVGADGTIHHVGEVGPGFVEELDRQIAGLLAGKDMATANRKNMAERNAARKQRKVDLKKAFAARGAGGPQK